MQLDKLCELTLHVKDGIDEEHKFETILFSEKCKIKNKDIAEFEMALRHRGIMKVYAIDFYSGYKFEFDISAEKFHDAHIITRKNKYD